MVKGGTMFLCVRDGLGGIGDVVFVSHIVKVGIV